MSLDSALSALPTIRLSSPWLCSDLSMGGLLGSPEVHKESEKNQSWLLWRWPTPVACSLQVAVASEAQPGDVSHRLGSCCTWAVLLDPTSRVSPRLRNNSHAQGSSTRLGTCSKHRKVGLHGTPGSLGLLAALSQELCLV